MERDMGTRIGRREFIARTARWGIAGTLGPTVFHGCAKMRRKRPNILVILLDALRADRVGCYGYGRPTTPNIDRIATEGAVMLRNYAQGPDTWISMPSFFSGLHPPACKADSCLKLVESIETFPEALAERGYNNFLFNSNPVVAKERGTTQGFEEITLFNRGDEFGSQMREMIRSASSAQPFFLFVHITVPHVPYDPPAEFIDKLVSERPATMDKLMRITSRDSRVKPEDANGWLSVFVEELPFSEAEKKCLNQLYDANIARADYYVGVADDEIDKLGLRDDTLLAIMSDHGEELFEHGFMDHGRRVHEELLRTPLVLRLPGQIPLLRAEALVENLDIGATLLDYAGGAREFGQGRSIRRVMEGRSQTIKRNTFGISSLEHLYPQVPELLALYTGTPALSHLVTRDAIAYGRLGMDKFVWSTSCVSDGRWRLTMNTATAQEVGLYELDADPFEKVNRLTPEGPEDAGRVRAGLRTRMDQWQEECEAFAANHMFCAAPPPDFLEASPGWVKSLTPEQKERLEKLRSIGYL